MAICRQCACYTSHKAVGLAKPCRHTAQGRHARLRRFMDWRHPEPGMTSIYVDEVIHLRRGEFGEYCSGRARGNAVPPQDGNMPRPAPATPSAAAAAAASSSSGDQQQVTGPAEANFVEASWDPALMESEPQPCDDAGGDEEGYDD